MNESDEPKKPSPYKELLDAVTSGEIQVRPPSVQEPEFERLSLTEVEERIEQINILANGRGGDDEAAHAAEDKLYRNVLFSIAHAPNYADKLELKKLARAALASQSIDFERHMA